MTVLINGVDITDIIAYQGLSWSWNAIDGPNAGRNINGLMIRDLIAGKIKLNISCIPQAKEKLRYIRNLMTESFTLMYDDPIDGMVTKTMYSNNIQAKYIQRINGTDYYQVTYPMIEM